MFGTEDAYAQELRLEDFNISPERGMLPDPDPDHIILPPLFHVWEGIAQDIPKLLVTDHARGVIAGIPLLDASFLDNDHLPAAMRMLSYAGNVFVWAYPNKPANWIPKSVAVPWYGVATRLGRPPILSYASYALDNWRRIDPDGPIALGNIVLLQNFMGGIDEEWFVLVHVDIEAKAGVALRGIVHAHNAVLRDESHEVDIGMQIAAGALEQMYATLLRMPEYCHPYIYYHRVRPYLSGWKDNKALPDGVIYEGVAAYKGKPQQFRGETGAQSGIIPALDAALGIRFTDDPLLPYLLDMRNYMPPKHRAFIEALEQRSHVRQYVYERRFSNPSLLRAYNACVEFLATFRAKHFQYAWEYIHEWGAKTGTGGTPFLAYLKKHLEETRAHLIA